MRARVLMLIAAMTLGAAGCYSSFNPLSGPPERDAGTPFDAGLVDAGLVDAGPVDAGPGPGLDAGPGPRVDAAPVDAPPVNPFMGIYEGTYMGDAMGGVYMEIRADGSLTMELRASDGTVASSHEGSIHVDGSLNAAGVIEGDLMVRFTGRFTGEPGSHVGTGEWHLEGSALMGTWRLHQVG